MRHSSLPVRGSYPRTKFDAFVTRIGPAGVIATVGVPHDGISSRSVFQTVSPVSAFTASRNESACVSIWMMTRPFQMIGELAGPHSNDGMSYAPTSMRPRSTFHRNCRSTSKACRPFDPNHATTMRPFVAGVRAGIRGFDVPLVRRLSFVRDALPQPFRRSSCRWRDRPLLARPIVRRVAVTVESRRNVALALAADGARDENAVAPHDRDSNARGRGLACATGCCRPSAVPGVGQVHALGDAGSRGDRETRASFRRPASLAGRQSGGGRPCARSCGRGVRPSRRPAARCCDRGSCGAACTRRTPRRRWSACSQCGHDIARAERRAPGRPA